MASLRLCDSCKGHITEINPVIAKVFLVPVKPGHVRADHGLYTAYAELGKCCQENILGLKWQKRKKRSKTHA